MSRNFETKMAEMRKNRNMRSNPLINTPTVYLIRMNAPFRTKWDLIVMMCAIWNCISIPLELSFEPPIAESIPWLIFNSLIDFLFLLDIILTFRTTYVSAQTGIEISDTREIAKNYLKGRFWIDFFTIFPFSYISFLTILRAIGILKISRVLRLGKIIDKLNAEEEFKQTLNLFKLVLNLLLFVHVTGCIWFNIINIEKKWVPTYDYITGTTEFYERGIYSQFITCFYTGVLVLNGNEIGPRTQLEVIFVTFILLVSAIINAHIFGSLAVIIQELSKKSARFYEKLDIANTTMKNLKLPRDIQKRVINYIIYTQSGFDKIDEMSSFKKMLSPSLNTEVVREIFSSVRPIFEDISSNLIDYVLEIISTSSFPPEDEIIRQGQIADKMFFLSTGE